MVFVFLFLTYFTLYDRLLVHPPHYNNSIMFLFTAEYYSIVYCKQTHERMLNIINH